MTTTTYAIGDIHGRLDLLNTLLDLIDADAVRRQTRSTVVFTGDYVDRGPDSYGVIERLIAGPRRPGDSFVCLRGNHDDLFMRAVAADDGIPDWAWQLFWHTITSYGLSRETFTPNHDAFRRHVAFLRGLSLIHDDGTHLFVHAGIRPGVAIEHQSDEDLTWIRDEFLTHVHPLPRRVVHGHTIMGDSPVTTPNRISIDTGAYKSGILTAAVIQGGDVSFLQAVGTPDRPALVREAILTERIAGRAVSADMQAAFDEFIASRIDVAALEERLRFARAA